MCEYREYKLNEKIQKYCEECGKDLVGRIEDKEVYVKYNICPRCKIIL